MIIVGYILFRGFYSSTLHRAEVIHRGETVHRLSQIDRKSTVIIHPGVQIQDLTVREVTELFKGSPSNWGNITHQDLDVHPFVQKGTEGSFGRRTTYVQSAEEMVQYVSQTKGAIGYVPAGYGEKTPRALKGVQTVPVRILAAVVSPSVLELRNNIKLRHLNAPDLEAVLRGEITNWRKIGGQDLPIRILLPPPGSAPRKSLENTLTSPGFSYPPGTRTAKRAGQIPALLEETPGAISFMDWRDARKARAEIVPVERRENGINLTWSYLVQPPKRAGKVGGVSSVIINTVFMICLTLLFATPIGIGAAIYLTEYARQGRLVALLRLGTETLAGIPSIIFGLFGFIFFVKLLGFGIGLLSGTLTITLMILPTIIRTSEEAIKSVPAAYAEGSLALGATKWTTIRKVVVPAAAPGILTGIILGIGRAIGETAALLFTMGFDYRMATSLGSSARVLSVHLYQLVKEGISFERAFATATILIIVILIVNFSTTYLIGRMKKQRK